MATIATDLERAGPHFVCPMCGGQDWSVIDTEFHVGTHGRPDRVWRRRACRNPGCGHRVSTEEVIVTLRHSA